MIIETIDATTASEVQFTVSGGLDADSVHVWSSNIATSELADDFVQHATQRPVNGVFKLTVEPGRVYSLTTTSGQFKGRDAAPGTVAQQLSLPFREISSDTAWANSRGIFPT